MKNNRNAKARAAKLDETEKLSKLTVSSFPILVDLWGLTPDEERKLLGCSLDDRNPALLPEDILARAGFVFGIYNHLQKLFPDKDPGEVVRNTRVFENLSALEVMLEGMPGLLLTYKFLQKKAINNE